MKKLKKYVRDYAAIVIGSFILALAVSMLLVPCKISSGGVSGIATLLFYLFEIPLWVTTLAINLLLFLLGFRFLPKSSLVKTLCGIICFSASLYLTDLIALLLPTLVEAVASDVFLASVFGGVLVGVGVGLVVKHDASTGGSDFAALSLNRLVPHISIGAFIMIIDATIIILSGILLGDLKIMLYSVVSLYIATKVTDLITVSADLARRVEIISEKSPEIASRIMSELERGVTAIDARGCYRGAERKVLLCILSPKEVPRLVGIVRSVDRGAFVVISEAREVRGFGFKEDLNFDYQKGDIKK